MKIFRNKISEYRRAAGYQQKDLARALNLHPNVLSNKLNGTAKARLTQPEVKQIIKFLAQCKALTRQDEVVELVELAGFSPSIFEAAEWKSPPLNWLENSSIKQNSITKPPPPERPVEKTSTEQIYNFPNYSTLFVGREKDLQALYILLTNKNTRLVTITGMGGIGKTSLGLQLAQNLHTTFQNGISFVALATVTEPLQVIWAICESLKLKIESEQSALEVIKNFLKHKKFLLILDNFEQVLIAAQLVSELLSATTELKILVTSRSILHLQQEHEYSLAPLPVPNLQNLPDVATLLTCESLVLLLARIRMSWPNFTLSETNARSLAEICVRLSGLPLAIELAAPRFKLFSPDSLVAKLRTNLTLLSQGALDVPERQRSLQKTLEWSYNLLELPDKQLFAIAAIFQGGFTLEAIEAVVGDNLDQTALLKSLTNLIDQSILQSSGLNTLDETRFSFLEILREYGLECLAAIPEQTLFQTRHCQYFVGLAEQTEAELVKEPVKWTLHLEQEIPNLRAALKWALENNQLEMALRIGAALPKFWLRRGYLAEGKHWLEEALKLVEKQKASPEQAALPVVSRAVLAKALNSIGLLAYRQGALLQANQFLEQSFQLYQTLNDAVGLAKCRNIMGNIAREQKNYAQARHYFQTNLEIYRQLNDKAGLFGALNNLALSLQGLGEFAQTRPLYEESLALCTALHDKEGMAIVLHNLAYLATKQGQCNQARQYLEQSQLIYSELKHPAGLSKTLLGLGVVALESAQPERAHFYLNEYLRLNRQWGKKREIAKALTNLGMVSLQQAEYAQAVQLAEESLALYKEMGEPNYPENLIILADAAKEQANYPVAAQQYNQSLTNFLELGDAFNVALVYYKLGMLAFCQRDYPTAQENLLKSLQGFKKIGNQLKISMCLTGLAWIALELADYDSGLMWLGAASSFSLTTLDPETIYFSQTEFHKLAELVIQLQTRLGLARFRQLWQKGQEEAAELLLSLTTNIRA